MELGRGWHTDYFIPWWFPVPSMYLEMKLDLYVKKLVGSVKFEELLMDCTA